MSAPPNILETTDQFRNQLILQERQAEAELARAYNQARSQLQDSLDNVTAKIVQLQNAGVEPKPWMLYEQANYVELIEKIEDEIQQIADDFGATIERMRLKAIELGDEMAVQLLGQSGVPITVRLPSDALIELVGRLQVGSPVDAALQKLGPEAAELIKDKLTAGLVSGWGPGQVAREISNALGTSLSHAMRISRTEMIQAYRSAALLNYNRYPNIIGGWIWTAAVGSATPPCFPAGAMVTTLTGSKAIETVRAGDMVLTHHGRFRPVIATSKTRYSGLTVKIKVGDRQIISTPEHPFYVLRDDVYQWLEASKLIEGDRVVLEKGSEIRMPFHTAIISTVAVQTQRIYQHVYNLEVEDASMHGRSVILGKSSRC